MFSNFNLRKKNLINLTNQHFHKCLLYTPLIKKEKSQKIFYWKNKFVFLFVCLFFHIISLIVYLIILQKTNKQTKQTNKTNQKQNKEKTKQSKINFIKSSNK